jgi:hypothetical protein
MRVIRPQLHTDVYCDGNNFILISPVKYYRYYRPCYVCYNLITGIRNTGQPIPANTPTLFITTTMKQFRITDPNRTGHYWLDVVEF